MIVLVNYQSTGGLQILMYKLFLLPFVVVSGALSALAKEPFYPDYTPTCNWAINKGAQQKLDSLAHEYRTNAWSKSFKEGYRYEDADTKRSRLRLKGISYNLDFGIKLIDLESHARRKYKCDLNVTIPPFPLYDLP